MELEETFKNTIGIEVSIAIHQLNNTAVSIKDVDKQIEGELKETFNTLTQLPEQDIINTYNSLKDTATFYLNSFDDFREAYY